MLYLILILFKYWKHHGFFRRRACDSRNFLPFFSPFFVFLFYDSAFVSRRPSREPRLSKSNEVALAVHRYRTFDVMIRFTTIYSWNHTQTGKFDTFQNLECPVSTTEKDRPPFLLDRDEENLVGKLTSFTVANTCLANPCFTVLVKFKAVETVHHPNQEKTVFSQK